MSDEKTREANRLAAKKYRESHKIDHAKRVRDWQNKNPEKTKEYRANYYLKNKTRLDEYRKSHYAKNRDKAISNAQKAKINNPAHYLFINARIRSRKNGVEFSIVESDIVVPKFCPALGIQLKFGTGNDHCCSPSLDRIDPTKGYVKGNVFVISHKANRIKNNASVNDLEMILKYIKQNTKNEHNNT